MRVLALTNMYPPHHHGGYELSCRDIVHRLRDRGHEVAVLTTDLRVPGVPDVPDERAEGVWRDLRFYWDDHELVRPPLHRRLAIERGNQRALRVALDRARPDVVSVWNMGALSLGLLQTLVETGVPLVYAVCDEWPVYGPMLDPWTRLFARHRRLGAVVARLTGVPTGPPADLGRSGTFCFVSDATRHRCEARSAWTFPDATVVYSGIDRDDFPPLGPPAEPRPWRWRLLYVGRIDERKGIATVVRALPLLPAETTLSVVGTGDAAHLAAIERLADDLEVVDRIDLTSAPRGELAARYAAADAFVFPSTWAEPFGLVPVEAMACGTPVVATGTGGSGEFLVDGGNCLLFAPGDAESLAAALTRLAGDPGLRARLVDGGLATATELDVDRLANAFEAWHVAAAHRFVDGRPAHRPTPVPPRVAAADRSQ